MNKIKPVLTSELDDKSIEMLARELANRSIFYILYVSFRDNVIRFFGGTPVHRSDLYYKIKIKRQGDS